MANIKSVGGNPIVLGLDGLTDDAKAALGNGRLSATSESLLGTPDTAQWATRESTGSGAATVRSVQGASVVWNQLTAPSRFTNNASTLNTVENVTTVTSTNQNGYYFGVMLRNAAGMISGHKYLVAYDVDRSGCVDTDFGAVSVFGFTTGMSNINSGHYWRIGTSSGANVYVNAVYNSANPHDLTGEYFTLTNVMLIDLTAMFGSGNEPTTVAEFEAMYPESYYPYSAPTLKPVTIAGIASTDAQGGELDSIDWSAQTLRAAGSVRDELTSDKLVTRVGVVDLGTLDWSYYGEGGYFRTVPYGWLRKYDQTSADIQVAGYPSVTRVTGLDKGAAISDFRRFIIKDTSFGGDVDAFKAAMSGVLCFYPVAEPTTTPISPALPMTFRVERGGTESIIVPSGEVSAPPVLTVAEGESAAELVMDALAAIAAPDGPVATSSHAVGTYLTMQGKLYKVTRVIAVGETIAEGTNVSETTVMAELLALTV